MLSFESGIGFVGDLKQNTSLWMFKPNIESWNH